MPKSPVTYAKETYKDALNGRYMSKSRIIRRVAKPRERTAVWVFEYGPTSLPPEHGREGLEEQILDLLYEFGARATFGVFGSTAENYPDTHSRPGTKYASGRLFEHYPAFGLDDMAGAPANPELIKRIAREGHELANYTYRAVPYAPVREMKRRTSFDSVEQAASDLLRLHTLVYELTHFNMRFTRPPYDIDSFANGTSAFDIYERFGYHRLSPGIEINLNTPGAAEKTIEKLLDNDPDSLSGTIIARRDGLDKYGAAPDIASLRRELELFEKNGYRIVSAGELLESSPFEDVESGSECFEAVRALDAAGFCAGFRNNRFYPDRELTTAELDAFLAPPGTAVNAVYTGGDTVKIRTITARASEIYIRVEGQPESALRADTAVWLAKTADLNGLLTKI